MATPIITGNMQANVGVIGRIYLADSGSTPVTPYGSVVAGLDAVGAFAEYIFLLGVAATAIGDVVSFDEAGVTAQVDSDTAASQLGFLAVALVANTTTTAGSGAWYALSGTFPVSLVANVADNAQLYTSSTAGALDDAKVSDQQVVGIMSRAATTGAAVVNCQFNRMYAHILMS